MTRLHRTGRSALLFVLALACCSCDGYSTLEVKALEGQLRDFHRRSLAARHREEEEAIGRVEKAKAELRELARLLPPSAARAETLYSGWLESCGCEDIELRRIEGPRRSGTTSQLKTGKKKRKKQKRRKPPGPPSVRLRVRASLPSPDLPVTMKCLARELGFHPPDDLHLVPSPSGNGFELKATVTLHFLDRWIPPATEATP